MEPEFDQTPPDSPAPRPEGSSTAKWYRGRPGLIVLTALITELVLIGGAANQGVAKSLQRYASDHITTMPDYTAGAIKSALTFQWRFAPANGQSTHVWAAQFAAIGTLLLLTAVFGWAVSRGSITFGRIWIGVGAVVVVSTPLAIMVRNLLVQPSTPGPLQSRLGQSVYGFPEFGPVIVEGLILGLIVGFFAALLAVITRTRLDLVDRSAARSDDGVFTGEFAPIPANAYGVPTPGYSPPPWQYDEPAPWPPANAPLQNAPTAMQSPVPPTGAPMPPAGMPPSGMPTGVLPEVGSPWQGSTQSPPPASAPGPQQRPSMPADGHTEVIPVQRAATSSQSTAADQRAHLGEAIAPHSTEPTSGAGAETQAQPPVHPPVQPQPQPQPPVQAQPQAHPPVQPQAQSPVQAPSAEQTQSPVQAPAAEQTQQIPVVPPLPAEPQPQQPVSGHSPQPLADVEPDPDLDFDDDHPAR